MNLVPFWRRDWQLLRADWKGLVLTFALPVVVAALSGWAFSGMGSSDHTLPLLLVDEDQTPATRRLVERLDRIAGIRLEELPAAATADVAAGRVRAHDAIRLGKRTAALLIPPGTGTRLEAGLFAGAFSRRPPELTLWVDPSHQAEVGMLQGALFQAAMEVVAADAFSPSGGQRQFAQWRRALERDDAADGPPELRAAMRRFMDEGDAFFHALEQAAPDGAAAPGDAPAADGAGAGAMMEPIRFHIEAVTAGGGADTPFAGYSAYAHAFAGMGVMFLLFGVLDGALFLIRERQRGTLARVVVSPTSAHGVLFGQLTFGIALGVAQLVVLLTVAAVFFGVRVVGSWPGLGLVVLAAAAAASAFGLLIAALFRTERQAQPVAILVILVMSALGGSWWPLFITPAIMQKLASATLTRWAVDGLEGALWRGWDFTEMLAPAGVLLAMAAALFAAAWWRFRYE